MPEPHPRGQAMYPFEFVFPAPHHIIDDLDYPVIVRISDRVVAVGGDFPVQLRYGCDDRMGVKVSTRRSVYETDDAFVGQVPDVTVWVDGGIFPGRSDDPVVVGV